MDSVEPDATLTSSLVTASASLLPSPSPNTQITLPPQPSYITTSTGIIITVTSEEPTDEETDGPTVNEPSSASGVRWSFSTVLLTVVALTFRMLL